MKRLTFWAVVNLVVFIASVTISYLSNTGLINSQTIGDVSDKYLTLFTPAGFTFSIWGLIYAGLTAMIIYHTIKAFNANENDRANKDFKKIAPLFLLNNIAASAWVIAWTSELLILSSVLLLTQMLCLLVINVRLNSYQPNAAWASKIFTQIPLSIYFAWLIIASIANISSTLKGLGWEGGGIEASHWAIFLVVLSALLTSFVILIRRNVFVGLVSIWALFGILSKLKMTGSEIFQPIISTAWGAILIISVVCIVQQIKNYRY